MIEACRSADPRLATLAGEARALLAEVVALGPGNPETGPREG